MKTLNYLSYIFLFVFSSAMLIVSCDKDISNGEDFTPIKPSNIDADAGTWDMIVLTSPDQIVVPAPVDTQTDAYKAELAAVEDLQKKLTKEKRDIIKYWSGGGVLRWNQFLRELVARYNLPPAPLADGSYPAPDAENPFADPNFPFANPPYAARAYSYVSVAQYEALKSAWHYKFLYNRPAPYKVSGSVKSLMPETDIPAYPSEDAVLSAVSVEMLKALFPAAIEEITLKAAEQRNAALWSGKATASDISAGVALGKAVAAQVMLRAGADGMRNAVGTKADWKKFADDCISKGETPWISRDLPIRPPMLPLFGKVRAWNMTEQDIVKERPTPPPSTSSEEMKKEVSEVKWYADNVTRDRLAIVHKWADGVGTYTPPGHWNDIAAEYIHDANYSEVRTARAFALLNTALHDAAVGCWEVKFYYFNPRPSQVDPSIKTCTGVPNFPAFTSGHSTFSGSAATVLSHLFPEHSEYFEKEAAEASVSRLYAGIHFRADIEMGMKHGKVIGGYTVSYALADGAE
ncbi:phosphatase PAP2 family protein [Chryseosolibacter indicus]|uniref:Phosphatase PAP2 family protein n=1 Tax=Chryseosolibacter indicus TaxID=2782351 RepID=A0ABS5VTL2_9BACT|nr:phosphatase PAP2 family protein [Chryseosolibacter indicus]MBT1704770.1 phosphatase PAP2 family protein [Chryseosolibacter indicus]